MHGPHLYSALDAPITPAVLWLVGEAGDGGRTEANAVASGSMQLRWDPASRVALLRFTTETSLTGTHGTVIAEAMEGWVGSGGEPFALLADAHGVRHTDAEYRAATGAFFGRHRDSARIALINLSPIIRIVAEMFRIARRLQLRTFPDETAARVWLRTRGVAA